MPNNEIARHLGRCLNNGLLIDLGPTHGNDHARMVELAERGRTQ